MAKKREYSLNCFMPIFQVIRQYYGMTDDKILKKMDFLEMNPDEEEWVEITNHIDLITLEQLIDRWHFDVEEGLQRDYLKTFLFFLANLYYGDNYEKALRRIDSTDDANYDRWYSNVREEVLKLYIDVDNYNKAVSKAWYNRIQWEKAWREQKAGERAARKKLLVKQLEEDYEPITGENWKEIQTNYSDHSDRVLDEEMGREMMAEPEWKELLKQEKAAEQVHIRFGKESGRPFPNINHWFIDLLNNHLFPWFIPDIADAASAKEELNRDPGRKPEDPRLRAIVNGTANYFYDIELVKSRTQSNLIGFLEKLLDLMTITCSDGKKADQKKIRKLIENLPNAEASPKFYTRDMQSVDSIPKVSPIDVHNEAIGWLICVDQQARKAWGLNDLEQKETPVENNSEESQEGGIATP